MNFIHAFFCLGHASPLHQGGFWEGIVHPVTGVDHLLAMLCVGALAVAGRAGVRWVYPPAFLGGMLLGGLLGAAGFPAEPVEAGIVGSVIVFGLILALVPQSRRPVMALLVGFFALFHGHAHVLEAPESGSMAGYAAGVLLATALLHTAGLLAGLVAGELPRGSLLLRLAGGSVALAGMVFLVI
jgi:urease accessory protein